MIEQFEEIYNSEIIHRYTGFLENVERSITFSNERAPQLTRLQKKALETEGFWQSDDANNLIIKGATSSGKTLLAELLIMQCLSDEKKAIYLVPLRALVAEKSKHFSVELKAGEDRRKVYGSSSDYQDHDAQLSEGNYDLGVIDYQRAGKDGFL